MSSAATPTPPVAGAPQALAQVLHDVRLHELLQQLRVGSAADAGQELRGLQLEARICGGVDSALATTIGIGSSSTQGQSTWPDPGYEGAAFRLLHD